MLYYNHNKYGKDFICFEETHATYLEEVLLFYPCKSITKLILISQIFSNFFKYEA